LITLHEYIFEAAMQYFSNNYSGI